MRDDSDGATGAPSSPGAATADQPAPIVVKKYANRRLYNTDTSSYVTLESLAAMVRAGQDFVVLDAKSGEDITRSVLTQIIFDEEARGRAPLLPTSFLRQLIRLYGHTLQGYVPPYLEVAMAAFERNQEAFHTHMTRSFGAAPGYAQFEAMTRANMELMRKSMSVWAPLAPAGGAVEGGAEPRSDGAEPKTDDAADLDELRNQVAAMQERLDALTKS